MNKEDFLKGANIENKNSLSEVYDKLFLASKTGKEIFTKYFYSPNMWKYLQKVVSQFGVSCSTYGVFSESERRIIGFNVYSTYNFPIIMIKISYNSKFTILKHKDFLGAITSLGIKREKIGDLILKDNECYVPIYEDLYEYIKINLSHIAKVPCKVQKLDNTQEIPEFNFEEKIIIINSNRLDAIVSDLCNISRNKALSLINSGKVLLDYEQVIRKDKKVEENSTIIIRGFGKFKMGQEMGCTAKGRIKVSFKKFI